jgi:large subunit ribosomal protein L4
MKINVFDTKGKTTENIDFSFDKAITELDSNILSQYVRIFQTNQRQGTVKTKDKSEVRGGGKKPWKQKGTGRARAGSSRSPLWVGGGVTHGPNPKSWSIKALKRLKRQAMQMAFVQKLNDDKAKIFDVSDELKNSTKKASSLLNSLKAEGKVLVLQANMPEVYKSFRNIPIVRICSIDEVSAYEILDSDVVIMDKNSFSIFTDKFFKGE